MLGDHNSAKKSYLAKTMKLIGFSKQNFSHQNSRKTFITTAVIGGFLIALFAYYWPNNESKKRYKISTNSNIPSLELSDTSNQNEIPNSSPEQNTQTNLLNQENVSLNTNLNIQSTTKSDSNNDSITHVTETINGVSKEHTFNSGTGSSSVNINVDVNPSSSSNLRIRERRGSTHVDFSQRSEVKN